MPISISNSRQLGLLATLVLLLAALALFFTLISIGALDAEDRLDLRLPVSDWFDPIH